MKKLLLFTFGLLFCNCILAEEPQPKIEKFELSQPKEAVLPYGSGLAFKNSNLYGAKYFYILASGSFKITDGKSPTAPEAVPHLALAKLKKKKLQIQARFPIISESEEYGIDPEGIALSADKTIWMADEGGGRLIQISADKGKVLQVLSIGKELPAILNQNQEGRGIEGVAVTPAGLIYAIMQSPLNINNESADSANFTRLLEYNPETKKSRMFAVPFERGQYYASDDIKFGDLQAVDNKRLLTIEQGKLKDGSAANKIILLDISTASDISNLKINGREPEFEADPKNIYSPNLIKPVSKSLLVDLRQYGWTYKKAEGLTLVNASTLAVINDWGDEIRENQLWLISLPNPLISWTAAEWFMIVLMGFITLLGIIFIWKVLISFKYGNRT